jgi:hypothetical protein
MQTQSFSFRNGSWSSFPALDSPDTLVLVFADPMYRDDAQAWNALRTHFSRSVILGCSTAGTIRGEDVQDGSVEGIAVRFERTKLQSASIVLDRDSDSDAAGRSLGNALAPENLKAVFLLGDALAINGSAFVRGLNESLPAGVGVSGGLAADGNRFQETWIVTNDYIGSQRVAAVGLYGEHVRVSHGSRGGFDKFGVERQVTRSEGAMLYELDGQPALKLYKMYLGEQALGLPASAMLFPLAIRDKHGSETVVRTILGIDEEKQSIQFAGEIPKGAMAQLMKANIDRLVAGASEAAEEAADGVSDSVQALAIAVSCVGRRVVMRGRVEEELEALQASLPATVEQIGFYSYGEVAPRDSKSICHLHNQTMTVTLVHE